MKALLIFLSSCSLAIFSDAVVVQTKLGPIKGQTISMLNEPVNVFRSIRYGEPPVGKQRFAKPKPYRWSGTFNATSEGPSCWQPPYLDMPVGNMSEDCLLLNVWTTSLNTSARLPVMVWIHGGGFTSGGINGLFSQYLNGSLLAAKQVVVVAINYRLHNLGFLFANSSEAPGNAGLYDQVLALKWVKDNIDAFGGNPNLITLFGESAGSMSIGFHLISPLSKNLFQRAILQSGSPYYFGGESNRAAILEKTKQTAQDMKCPTKDTRSMMECLKKVDPKKLSESSMGIAEPIVGDEFNPVPAKQVMRSGGANHDILAGMTSDEGSWFIKYSFLNQTVDKTFIKRSLAGMADNFFRKKVDADQLFNHYFGALNQNQWANASLLKQLMSNVVGDNFITCSTYFQVSDYAQQSNRNNAMFYVLEYKAKEFANILDCNEHWQGSCHGQDLAFTFGTPLFVPGNWTQADRVMAALAVYYWTNFAKTGNPFSSPPPAMTKSVKNIELWPNITWIKHQPTLGLPAMVMRLNPEKVSYAIDPWKRNCDEYWSRNMD